jgi:murein DD-endopeptidase MepM/ murein hydrolase activator NlpD
MRLVVSFRRMARWKKGLLVLGGVVVLAGGGIVVLYVYSQSQSNSAKYIDRWFDDKSSRSVLSTVQREPCPGAPFLLPSDGLVGLLWRDSAVPYNILRRHSGLDIFGDGEPGSVPVYAAYEGYLTRLPDWKASVIIRHDDPLQPGRTIWTYYTHMAARDGSESFVVDDFPPGTSEAWVKQGTLLGYQGEYNGDGLFAIGLHIHFSIVKSEPDGSFKNESHPGNTLDPSPYLGMDLNIKSKPARPIQCKTADR